VVAKYFWKLAIKRAEKTKRNTRLWGGFVVFVFYNIIFWDLIPVYALHTYKCSTEGGLIINKTLDKWKQENSGVADTLNPNPDVTQRQFLIKEEGLEKTYQLSDGTLLTAYYDVKRNYMYTKLKRVDGADASWLNQRFISEHSNNNIWYIVRKKEDRIIDILTGEIMAKSIDFYTDLSNPLVNSKNIRDLKMWMKIDSCEKGQHYEQKIKLFGDFK
ncbi:MAG: hypothetical protein ABL919_16195, partial [Methylococcales bacterium]